MIRKTFDYDVCEDIYFTLKSHEEERDVHMKELESKLTQIQNEYERKLQVRAEKHEEELRKAKDIAMAEMIKQAEELGANAIVGVDLDYEAISSGQSTTMMMVSANGTAVNIE
ncbi:MAG: heavy metal-binding domain-containing protein [Candidatus Sericytochromatia bacterium]